MFEMSLRCFRECTNLEHCASVGRFRVQAGAQGAPLRTRSRALNGKGAIVPQGPSGEVTQLCCWPRNGAPCHLDWFLGVRFILNYILS